MKLYVAEVGLIGDTILNRLEPSSQNQKPKRARLSDKRNRKRCKFKITLQYSRSIVSAIGLVRYFILSRQLCGYQRKATVSNSLARTLRLSTERVKFFIR